MRSTVAFLPNFNLPNQGLPNQPGYSFLPDMLAPSGGLPGMNPSAWGLPNISPGSWGLPAFGGTGFLPNLQTPSMGLPNMTLPNWGGLWDNAQHPAGAPARPTAPSPGYNPGPASVYPNPTPDRQPGAVSGPANSHAAPYMSMVNQVSSETGVPADVLAGIIDTENSGENAVSSANARGIMQVVGGPLDPLESIRAGARVLQDKMRINGYASDDWDHAAGAYFGFGTDSGGMTTNNYMQRFHGNRANYISPAAPSLRSTVDAASNTTTPGGYVFPVDGYTSRRVQNHWGEVPGGSDLFAARGSPVRAMRSGLVLESGWNAVGGNSVLIRGDDGNQYYYAHFDAPPSVQTGQQVRAGTFLGPVGNTGDAASTAPHLHIGIGPEIRLGSDKYGGTGGNYPAVQLLQDVLDGVR